MNKEQFKEMFLECLKEDKEFRQHIYKILDDDSSFTTLVNDQRFWI